MVDLRKKAQMANVLGQHNRITNKFTRVWYENHRGQKKYSVSIKS